MDVDFISHAIITEEIGRADPSDAHNALGAEISLVEVKRGYPSLDDRPDCFYLGMLADISWNGQTARRACSPR
jgi:hypothetical protein